MNLMYRCPKCTNLVYPQNLGTCACVSCEASLLNEDLAIVAARNSDTSYTNMPFTFEVSEENLKLEEKVPYSNPESPVYGLCFAEFFRIKRAKVIQENCPWSVYVDYLIESIETEFSQNKAQLDYFLCRWLMTSISMEEVSSSGIERKLVFQEALAIFYMREAQRSGYRFTENKEPIGHDKILLIADRLDTEEVKNELLQCIDSSLSCVLYNPIMKATLACMPYRDESVENELSSFVGLNKLVNN